MHHIAGIGIIVAAVIVGAMATAQAQDGKVVIIPHRDGFSCGKWTNAPKRTPEREIYEKWVLGYLSGINVEHTGPDFLRDRDTDGMKAWIDNYCRRNPLHPIAQAVAELIKDLRSGR